MEKGLTFFLHMWTVVTNSKFELGFSYKQSLSEGLLFKRFREMVTFGTTIIFLNTMPLEEQQLTAIAIMCNLKKWSKYLNATNGLNIKTAGNSLRLSHFLTPLRTKHVRLCNGYVTVRRIVFAERVLSTGPKLIGVVQTARTYARNYS